MVQGPAIEEREIREETDQDEEYRCRHHWIIDSPQGATSWGQCKICGARKEFPNSAGDALWERDPVAPSGRWGGVTRVTLGMGDSGGEPALPHAGWSAGAHDDEGF